MSAIEIGIFATLTLASQLAIAVVLIRKFLRTREVGFVWLGAAVIIWPLVSSLLDQGERLLIDSHSRGHLIGVFPFSLVESGQTTIGSLVLSFTLLQKLIGVVLLLVAVLYLSKTKSGSDPQAAGT